MKRNILRIIIALTTLSLCVVSYADTTDLIVPKKFGFSDFGSDMSNPTIMKKEEILGNSLVKTTQANQDENGKIITLSFENVENMSDDEIKLNVKYMLKAIEKFIFSDVKLENDFFTNVKIVGKNGSDVKVSFEIKYPAEHYNKMNDFVKNFVANEKISKVTDWIREIIKDKTKDIDVNALKNEHKKEKKKEEKENRFLLDDLSFKTDSFLFPFGMSLLTDNEKTEEEKIDMEELERAKRNSEIRKQALNDRKIESIENAKLSAESSINLLRKLKDISQSGSFQKYQSSLFEQIKSI